MSHPHDPNNPGAQHNPPGTAQPPTGTPPASADDGRTDAVPNPSSEAGPQSPAEPTTVTPAPGSAPGAFPPAASSGPAGQSPYAPGTVPPGASPGPVPGQFHPTQQASVGYGQQPPVAPAGQAPHPGEPSAPPSGQYGQFGQPGQQYAQPGQQFSQPGQQYGQQAPGYGPSGPQYVQPGQQYAQPGQQPGQAFGQPGYGAAGHPGQPGHQGHPGQQGQPAQFGQFGAPGGDQYSAMAAGKPNRGPRTAMFAVGGALLLVALVVLLTAFWIPPKWAPRNLDQNAAQDGVKKVLTESYQASEVTDVRCPSGQRVKKGESFTCSVSVGGQQQRVKVTFLDDDGRYEVARPTS
ncbi:hypothetical protein GCM10009624_06550 [Gordonia sinesedis]